MDFTNSISFSHPGRIVFGNGSIKQLKADCLEKNLVRLYILSVEPLKGVLKKHLTALRGAGIKVEMDYSVQNEPSFEEFEIILKRARSYNPDGIVGIGGGSVLDVAKLLAAQLKNSQQLDEIVGINLLKERKTWVACIPTTSGTGSEVSPNAIFLDELNGGKKGVISPFLVPDIAYIDPSLTLTLPASVTAATGIDALTHCIEAYMNKFAHPMTDLYALEGIKLIASALPKACKNGSDLEARTQLALGSLYGGMCLGPVNTAAVHALAYPPGSMFGISHGLANALMLTAVMRFNMQAAPSRFADVATALGAKRKKNDALTSLVGIRLLRSLLEECGIPSGLSVVGIPKSAVKEMAVEALKVQRLLKNNLRNVSLEDAVTIYKEAY